MRALTTWIGLFMLMVAGGCRLSPERQLEVEASVHQVRDRALTCPPEQDDRCAMPSALWALGDAPQPHVALLEHGGDALLARLHAIRTARRSIELQTFIFVADDAGNLLLTELLEAARRGVKVRILIDQLYAFEDADFLAGVATAHQNLEIKVYNPTFGKGETSLFDFAGSLVCCFQEFNHRMHNKVFVVDDRIGITGGRNVQNRYYGWDPQFNYLDRDVLVLGEVARTIRESFDEYWVHPRTVHAEYLLDVAEQILNGVAQAPQLSMQQLPHARAMAAAAGSQAALADRLLPLLVPVHAVEYFADPPDKLFDKNAREVRDITLRLRELIATARHSVIMQTPYLVFTRRATRLFARLRREHPDIQLLISTNSLASTDAYPVYAVSRKRRKPLLKSLGFHIYELKPHPADLSYWFPPGEGRAAPGDPSMLNSFPLETSAERASLHGKTLVIDGLITVIGSHNFDPRSEDYNTESGLIIVDREIADVASREILRATQSGNAWVVARAPQVPVMSFFSGIIGSVSRRLPIGDIWPFRYATSYDLIPGNEPVPPDHPEFQERYRNVGEFPGVNLSLKQIQTQLISAFAGFVKPIL
ncbi:MAG: phospholipase D family protein [Xanthomonadales bacterium]|nr:phospholipase D family protein [Xanthomonadales bacterium]